MTGALSLTWRHSQAKFLHLLRQPSYVIATLVFPSLFFLFFAAPNADTPAKANLLLGSFAAFAVLGVMFFQFGLDYAQERESAWFHYVRTLPIRPWQFFLARALTALAYAILAAAVVVIVVLASTPAQVTALQLLHLALALIVGSLPFCLMGLAIGSFTSASSALPIINLVYLVLSFAGGLWIPPAGLSPSVQKVSEYLPSRFYGEWAWSVMSGEAVATRNIAGLALTAILVLPFLWYGYRRSKN